jgi:hypothetical protein
VGTPSTPERPVASRARPTLRRLPPTCANATLNNCMGYRTGSADLPLHGGRVPPWLAERMAKLGRVLVEAIVLHYGRKELLRRFQSFGCVMGMDWHSSGITTSVVGALKRGLAPIENELGIHVCGGRGKHSRRTPDELRALGDRLGVDATTHIRASRLVAKVDSAAVQDGFQIYLHSFVVTDDGDWTVIQQGMNPNARQARRYHWLSEGLQSFVDEPHSAIEGRPGPPIVNLTDRRAARSRDAQVALSLEGPERVLKELARIQTAREQLPLPHLQMPAHHEVTAQDLVLRRLHGGLAAARDRGPKDFAELLLTPGLGARTVLALATVAEVLHGAPSRFSDPARFSIAHGGKDGHPFPVPLRVYDQTLRVMREAVNQAKLGREEKLAAIRRLDQEARRLEQTIGGPSWENFEKQERARSAEYGGMTVNGPAPSPPRAGVHSKATRLVILLSADSPT